MSYRDMFNKLDNERSGNKPKFKIKTGRPKFKGMENILNNSFSKGNKKLLPKRLSFFTFTRHLEKLEKEKMIQRTKKINGKKRFCYLTRIGKRFYGLNKINKSTNKILYKKVFQELFFHEFNKDAIFFHDRDNFTNYLNRCGISENEIEWTVKPLETSSNTEIINFLYESTYNGDNETSKMWKNFWKKQKNSFILEDFYWIAKPITKEGYPINFYRIDHWQINKDGNNNNYANTYEIDLPGIYYNLDTIPKICYLSYETVNKKNKKIKKIKFTKKDIKKIIESFAKYKIVKIIQLGNNQRILISDYRLFKLIDDIMGLLAYEYALLKFHCSLYKRPEKDEIKRMELLIGKQESKSFFQTLSILRGEEIKKRRALITEREIIEKTTNDNNFSGPPEKSILYQYFKSISFIFDTNSSNYVRNTLYYNSTELDIIKKFPQFQIYDNDLSYYEQFILSPEIKYYLNSYISKEKEQLNAQITRLNQRKTILNPVQLQIENKNIVHNVNQLEKKQKRLENLSDIENFIEYMKKVYLYDYLQWIKNILEIKGIYQNLFIQYGDILDELFNDTFPLLKQVSLDEITKLIENNDLQTKLEIDKNSELDDLELAITKEKNYNEMAEKIQSGKLKLKPINLSNIDASGAAEIKQKLEGQKL